MNFAVTVNESKLANDIAHVAESAEPNILGAMRDRFMQIVDANFGIAGPERPWAWEPLSPAYAKKVGRTYATLFVSGALKSSLAAGGISGNSVTVEMSDSSVPYTTAHHFGNPPGNKSHPGLPSRRVFPLNNQDEVLPWTQSQVTEAAQKAMNEFLQ